MVFSETLYLIETIQNVNITLLKRIGKIKSSYYMLTYFFLAITTSIAISIFLDFESFSQKIDQSINALVYLFLMFILFLMTLRFSSDTVVLLNKMIVFPLSNQVKYLYLIYNFAYDIHSLIYLVPVFFIFIKCSLELGIVFGISFLVIFVLFFIVLVIWITNCYIFFSRILDKIGKNTLIIYPVLSLGFFLMQNNNNFTIINDIPFWGFIGRCMISLQNGEYDFFLIAILGYLIFGSIGFFVGKYLIKYTSYQ
jgi:hypothetical protein